MLIKQRYSGFLKAVLGATLTFALNGSFGQIDHWETVVFEDDTWRYLVPTGPVDPSWNEDGFDVSGWPTGPGGFGYGDGDDNTMLAPGTVTCFQRIEFNIVDKDDIPSGMLTLDYDDAFVAYLNGQEIARNFLSGEDPAWNQDAEGLHEAQMYSGGYPSEFVLSECFLAEALVNGTNVLAIQTHNRYSSSSDMSSRAWLHFGIASSATNYSTPPAWFVEPSFIGLTESNLPIVVIDTYQGVSIPDEPKVLATMGIINNGEGEINNINDPYEFVGEMGIEIRGSSSQMFPKKGYGVETWGPDSSNYDATIFDWPADNDWVLHAPYSDKTLIRNVLTYKLGNELGEYAPRTKLVELVINCDYKGVYVFTERIKQNPGRVDVDKLNYEDTDPMEITGGYIFKVDKTTGGGVVAWTSPYPQAAPATGPIRLQLHDPPLDTLHPDQLSYIQNFFTDFEDALAGPSFDDPVDGYLPYIDLKSWIDFMIMNEVSKNVDGYRISTFLHKERDDQGGKIVKGPLWDFNLAFGNANYCGGEPTDGWEIYFNNICGGGGALNNPFWYPRMVMDPAYTHALNCRWQELRMDELHTDSILAYVDELAIMLDEPADRNFTRWPTLGTYVWPNTCSGACPTYDDEIQWMKNWIVNRMNWLDANMFGSCPDLSTDEQSFELSVFPNPSDGSFVISTNQVESYQLGIYNSLGQLVFERAYSNTSVVNLDLDLPEGYYHISLTDSKDNRLNHPLIIK